MELVYLWVEEYKNIHRQGFNFSPRFRCAYDHESNELAIDDNPDHIENFFGDNINVTAIVGKNGSGKSSVFEILAFLYKQGTIPITGKKDKTFFLYESDGYFHIQCENYKIHSGGFKELFKIINNKTNISLGTRLTHRTSMPLISFSNCISDMTHNKHLNNLKNYDNFYNGIQPINPMKTSKFTYDDFNQKFQYIFKKNKSFFNFVDKKIIFENFQFELHIFEIAMFFTGPDSCKSIVPFQRGTNLLKAINKANSNQFLYRYIALFIIYKTELIIINNDIDTDRRKKKDEYVKKNICMKVESIFQKEYFDDMLYTQVLDICLKVLEQATIDFKDTIGEGFIKKDFTSIKIKELLKKYSYYEKEEDVWKSKIFSVENTKIQDTLTTILEKDLFDHQILRCNFLNKKNPEYSFLKLSSGEKLYLNLLTNYVYTLYNLNDNYRGLMLFDEIELSYHPAWQKSIIGHLVYIFNKLQKEKEVNLHLIFTTHSPFLLSDIPKQNIIFLDKEENGNCKVVNGLKDKKQTFGANIHTLLSDSFFMSDGLMGEFAKGKINEIIKFHQITKKNRYKKCLQKIYEKREKGFRQTQSIIGDPYLKQVLENHLLEIDKFFDKKVAKEKLKARLEKQLAELDDD